MSVDVVRQGDYPRAAANGLTVVADGAIYISNFSIFPGGGQVVRLDSAATAGALPLNAAAADELDVIKYLYLPALRYH